MRARAKWSAEEIDAARERVRAALQSGAVEAIGLESVEVPRRTAAQPLPASVQIFGPAFRAAAVLSRFRLDDVRELASDSEEIARLQSRSIALREQGWRTLTPDVRVQILRSLDAAELRALLQRHAQIDDALQAAIRAALDGHELRTLSTGALGALMQIYDGLADVAKLAPREQIERRLQLARLLDPLRQITKTFSGRKAEIQKLRDYVGVLSTGSWLGDGLRAVGKFLFKPEPTPPFFVHGPGGVGKTTLTAQFILEHALHAEQQRFPFAYLDFDRPTVNAEYSPTILVEAVRQIGLQYDTAFSASERLRDRWEKRLATSTGVEITPYVLDFAGFVQQLEVRDSPVLLVLDTFEEVQRRSDAYVQSVLGLVKELTNHVPRLRVVIAGRSKIEGSETAGDVELTAFDHESAIAYLQANKIDAAAAELIANLTKGNPLTLTLAIELHRRNPDAFRGIDAAQLSDEIIQSALFDRILLHIADPEVRRLAHPGLVLRRVTPEIIRIVLAGPCEIEVPDDHRADVLFDKLAADNTLVTRVEPRVLIHRSDVRRMMLGPLRDHEPEKVREIHRGAVDYYSRFDDVISRAEAAYHRLCLGEETELTDDLEPLLVNAKDDLPLPSQAVLASRYGLTLSEDARAAADQETWERLAISRLGELLRTGNVQGAPKILAERSERSARNNLMVLEAMCHDSLGDNDYARELARRGIASYRDVGNSMDLFDMLLVAAEIERRAGPFDAAHSYLADAEEIARRRNDALMLVRVLRDRARLLRTEGAHPDPELQRDLAAAAAQLPAAKWLHDPVLVRDVLIDTALENPSLLTRIVHLGALTLTKSDLDYLARRTGEPAHAVLERLAEAPTRDGLEALVAILRQEEAGEDRRLSAPVAQSANIKLKTAQREQLRDLLVRQLGNGLASFVEVRYQRGLESLSFADESDVPRTAMDVVRAAEREGWLNELIVGLWRARFVTPEVLAFIDSIGLGPIVRVAKGQTPATEKQLRQLLTDYRVAIGALEMRTCMIDDGEKQTGCGFLTGPSGVATAPSTLVSEHPAVTFDSVILRGKEIVKGRHMTGPSMIGNGPDVKWLMHVNASLSRFPIDQVRSAPDAPLRGAVTFSNARIDPRAPLFWLWRTQEGTFLSGASQVVVQPDGQHIVECVATDEMRGAPVFDAALNVVGIHYGRSGNDPRLSVIVTPTAVPASSPSAP